MMIPRCLNSDTLSSGFPFNNMSGGFLASTLFSVYSDTCSSGLPSVVGGGLIEMEHAVKLVT